MKLYNQDDESILRSQHKDPLMRHLTDKIMAELPTGNGRTLLDVGCGAGRTAMAAWEKGYKVLGIDIEKKVIDMALQHADLEFRVADVTKLKGITKIKFDVVVCSEVIEHVLNPQKVLESAVSLLKEDGIIVLTTPNGMEQWSILDDFGEHKRRYSRVDLEVLFERSGLKIKNIYTVGWPFMRFVVWTYDKIARFLRIKHGSHLEKGLFFGKLYPLLIGKLLKIDDVFNNIQKGTNWLVIARKSNQQS